MTMFDWNLVERLLIILFFVLYILLLLSFVTSHSFGVAIVYCLLSDSNLDGVASRPILCLFCVKMHRAS